MLCDNTNNNKINYTDIKGYNFKQYRDAWSDALKAKILTNFPLHLDLELTSECNLRCAMCWQAKDPNAFPKGMMTEELFKKIIDEGVANGLCAIKLQSRGEAMMHPKIFEFSKYAKSKGIKDIHLTTNGTLFMKTKKMAQLFDSGIDKLIFSIDKAHDESIDEIYKTKKPDIRKYFNEIGKIKKEKNLKAPFLVVQTFADKDKIEEVRQKLKKEYKCANSVNVNTLFESNPDEPSIDMINSKIEYLPCSYLWTRLMVFFDGTTTTCCRDYSGKYLFLGDANLKSIYEMWNGKKMNNFRRLHQTGKRQQIEICKNCDISTVITKA